MQRDHYSPADVAPRKHIIVDDPNGRSASASKNASAPTPSLVSPVSVQGSIAPPGSEAWLQARILTIEEGPAVLDFLKSPTSLIALRNTKHIKFPGGVNLANEMSQITGLLRIYARNIQSLYFENPGAFGLIGSENLGKMENLTTLSVEFAYIDIEEVKNISRSKTLSRLRLDACSLPYGSSAILSKVSGLRSLDLSRNDFSDEDFQHITSMSGLRELVLCNTDIGSKHYPALGLMKSLEYLDLQYNKVQDEALKFLTGLSHLKVLDLRQNLSLGSKGLKNLVKLKNLNEIWCAWCELSQTDFDQVPELKDKIILRKYKTVFSF